MHVDVAIGSGYSKDLVWHDSLLLFLIELHGRVLMLLHWNQKPTLWRQNSAVMAMKNRYITVHTHCFL